MATAQRAWLLLAVATSTVACAQILGIQPWEPADAGLGGGSTTSDSTGTTTASSTGSTSATSSTSSTSATGSTSSTSATSSTTSTTTTSSATTSTSSGGPTCMAGNSSCFACQNCANGGACMGEHDMCQNDTSGACKALENCVLGCADANCIKTTCMTEAGALFTNWVQCYCHQCGSASVCTAVFQEYCADAGP